MGCDKVEWYMAQFQRNLLEDQRQAVLEEVNNLLSDSTFKHSKRSISLLRALVERALAKNYAGLKERILGVEVFGRDANYDTNDDPVVRMTATDIRKRLAQYYENPDHHRAVRIHLVPGSYIPEFDFNDSDQSKSADAAEAHSSGIDPPRASLTNVHNGDTRQIVHEPGLSVAPFIDAGKGKTAAPPMLWRKLVLLIIVLLAAVAAGFALVRTYSFRSTQELVWEPLLPSNGGDDTVMICLSDSASLSQGSKEQRIADLNNMVARNKTPQVAGSAKAPLTITFDVANDMYRVVSWLASHGQRTLLQSSSTVSFEDFHRRPSVLIGSAYDIWSVILLSNLRFSGHIDPTTGVSYVQDAKNPSSRNWAQASYDSPVEYAIITRYLNAETRNWVLAITGLGPYGTKAAVDLLLDPSFAKSLPPAVRHSGNFQIVLRTTLVNGNPGPPQVIAFQSL